jgi:sugar/nucleoside kinase (ribokinase family)
MSNLDVLVVGELNVDLILRGEVTPEFGQTEKLVDDATLTLGSSSAIFACGAARLGLQVAFIGKVGADEFGRFVVRSLEDRRVDVSRVVVDPEIKTGLSVILSRGSDRAILTHLGSIAALRYDEIDPSTLASARHLHVGSYFLLDALRPDMPALFKAARARGLTTSLDTNYDPAETWNGGLSAVLAETDIFLPNETELCAIAGEDDVAAALSKVAGQVPSVAVKLGASGAVARQGENVVQAEAYPLTVVDSTGAGDSFNAGFIYGYLQGETLPAALRLGCACGSLSTRAAGGINAQPTLAETMSLLGGETRD